MHYIDYVIVASYLLLTLFVGIQQGRKIKDMKDYAVGDYTFSSKVLFATIAATVIGAPQTIGAAEKVFGVGIVYILIWLGQPVCQFIMGTYIVPRMARFKGMLSVAEIMGDFYGKQGRIFTGIVTVIYSAGLLSAQVYAMGHIFNYFMGVPEFVGVLIGCGVIICYATMGGIRSVTITDVIQFTVLIITIPLICAAGLEKVGGFSALINAVPQERFVIIDENIFNNIAIFIAFAIPFMNPPMTQRVLMAKSVDQIKTSLKLTVVISVPFFIIVGLIGLISLVINPELSPNLALPYLISDILPIGLKGLAIAGLLAVIMSSADSYLNAASVSFVHDVIERVRKTPLPTEKKLNYAKLATLLMGIGSVAVALFSTSITSIFLGALSFWAPVVATPLIAGIFGYRASMRTFWLTVATGVLTCVAWDYEIKPIINVSGLLPSLLAASLVFFSLRKFVDKISKTPEFRYTAPSQFKPRLSFTVKVERFANKVLARKTPYAFFASFIIANNLIPYLLLAGDSPHSDLNLTLRVISSFLCIMVLLKDGVLESSIAKLALWYGTLLLSLPLLSTYVMMSGGVSHFWVGNAVVSLLVLMFMVDWKSFLGISVLGITIGTGFFMISSEQTLTSSNLLLMGYTFSISLLIGAIFAKKLEQLAENNKLEMKMMAGAIAHEMRTPLSMINIQSHVLGKAIKDVEALATLSSLPQQIMNVAEEAQRVIDRTLANLSDQSSLNLVSLSLNEVIDKTLEDFPYQPEQKQRIIWNKGSDEQVTGDKRAFIQVIDNLLKNALYYTEPNQGTITIWTEAYNQEVKIHLKDTGTGIEEENLKKVFTPFFSKRTGGTGIGLAFCKETIENFGGTIECASEFGKSTTFTITLPTHQSQIKVA